MTRFAVITLCLIVLVLLPFVIWGEALSDLVLGSPDGAPLGADPSLAWMVGI